MRRQLLVFGVYSLHDEEFVEQALHKKTVIQPSDEGRYAFLTTSKYFQWLVSNLLALEVKVEEKDKAFLLLSSLLSSYDHLATTIMYENETLELKDVRQIL